MINYTELGSQKPEKIVILMHGYGSNKDDMSGLAEEILQNKTIKEKVKFICPDGISPWEHFPESNARQWFSLATREVPFVHQGLINAAKTLTPFIDEILKKNNLLPKDLFLAGFSQGAMLSLHKGIEMEEKIAGIISFSGKGIRDKNEAKTIQDIVFIHGEIDEVLLCTYSKMASRDMKSVGWNSTFFEIKNMAHSINRECVEIASDFILKRI